MGLESSAEQPIPLRTVSKAVGDWIGRLGRVWVEGEVAQLSRRPGAQMIFLTLRDTEAAMSMQITTNARVIDAVSPPLAEGQRVIVHAQPRYYPGRGTLSLAVTEIRPVGLGELLARIEMLRSMLASEGLFAAERKRPLPFLPHTIGLISGRAAAAERDVVENARKRWPAVQFRIINTAVQGAQAVPQILDALEVLEADASVDVVVISRGGGSVEDLLPFSDETLLRAVSAHSKPVVSAIGHEQDSPLLDLVADVRASTPTDAARRLVPDVIEELDKVRRVRERVEGAIHRFVNQEQHRLDALRSRPVLAAPHGLVDALELQVNGLRERSNRSLGNRLRHEALDVEHIRARVRAVSPMATLERGYAVVQRADGHVVTQTGDVKAGQSVRLRLAEGELHATIEP